MSIKVPKYRDLPIRRDAPAGASWGVFDNDTRTDRYGTLNFATGEAVVRAREEIKTGESIALNLPLHLPYKAVPGRLQLQHKVITHFSGMTACDDEIAINTQSSSQWDGLMHWAIPDRMQFYNGINWTDAAEKKNDISLGIQSLSDRGGIVARGVLLDFVRYSLKHGIEYDPYDNYAITLDQIKEMIREENLTIRQGDILVIRCGLDKAIKTSTPENAKKIEKLMGVDPTHELLEWIWDNNFAAIAGDSVAFEAFPAPDGSVMKLHTAAIPGWGMPIGELLDLEKLSEVAERNQRWSFFMTVCPLNVKGGISTLANTLAVF